MELGDETYMEFFYTLNRSRGMTDMGGPQHVSIVDMEALLRLWGIDQRDHRLKYVRIAQNLDSIYLDHIAEKRESASRQKEK